MEGVTRYLMTQLLTDLVHGLRGSRLPQFRILAVDGHEPGADACGQTGSEINGFGGVSSTRGCASGASHAPLGAHTAQQSRRGGTS